MRGISAAMTALAVPLASAWRPPRTPSPFAEAVEGAVEVVAMHFPAGELSVLEPKGGEPGLLRGLRGVRLATCDLAADGPALDRLRTFEEPARRHQVVVCSRLLERLDDPQAAVRRLCRTLAAGGLLVVAGVVPGSAAGLLGRLGGGGRRPRLAAGPDAIKDLAAGLGLEVVYEALTADAPPGSALAATGLAALMWGLRIASAGLWRPDLSRMVLVLRRD